MRFLISYIEKKCGIAALVAYRNSKYKLCYVKSK